MRSPRSSAPVSQRRRQRYYTRPDPKDFPVKKASYPESWSRKWPGDDYRLQYTLNDNSLPT
ncbi:MAG: hypothetical protein R2724_17535 [Bryobacterales bacterium]